MEEFIMSIEVKEIGKNQVEFSVKVAADKFREATDKAFRKNVKSINVPGFRRGKAPRALIEKMYGAEIFYNDAVDELLPDAYDEAVKETGLDIVSKPDVDINEISKEDGFTFIVKAFIKPTAIVKDYKGIPARKVVYTVKDEEINAEIERVRERNSRIVPVEDRAIENGDIANIDYEGFVDGVAFAGGKDEGHDLTIGEGQFIPGFEDGLTGYGTGDDVTIKVTFPEDYHSEDLKGKDAEFKVKINKVSIKELPELDDELAKDVSEFDTLDEYKDSIKEKIQKSQNERSDTEFENEIVDKICESVSLEIPDCMIEDRTEILVRDADNNMKNQGFERKFYLKYLGVSEADYIARYREQAAVQVKSTLVLEAIAKAEGIEANETETNEELERIAKHYGLDKDKIADVIVIDEIKKDIIIRKTVTFLRENAKAEEITEEDVKKEVEKIAEENNKKEKEEKSPDAPAKPKRAPRKKKTEETAE
jgi:trigger factor